MRALKLLAASIVALLLAISSAATAIELSAHFPQHGQTVYTGTPTLVIDYTGELDPTNIAIEIDGLAIEETPIVNPTNITHTVEPFLALAEGNHTLRVTVGDARVEIVFLVNHTLPPEPAAPLDTRLLVIVAGVGVIALGLAGAGLYVWARKARRFTFRKHFLRHPGQLRFVVLYVPSGLAVLATLAALYIVASMSAPPRYAWELVLATGGAMAVGPFGIQAAQATARTRAYERAFAQFLFELADAVRGGIDPVKAVQELAKTQGGLLRSPIKRAADILRLGRPMEDALREMTSGMGSSLVSRYASLVGEASSMGGSVAGVMQRAAKDMDDLVKLMAHRRRDLRQPVFTMYMAFGVLLLMILQIVGFAPNIGDLNLGALAGGETKPQVARMGIPAMQSAFFHLLLLNALGSGLLVGSFTEGRFRNGILHAIVMTGTACLAYPLAT